jgi:hypothetical protein
LSEKKTTMKKWLKYDGRTERKEKEKIIRN